MRSIQNISRFKREIIIVLMIKLVLIFSLKYAFFNDPVSQHLTEDEVSRVFLGQPSH